MKYFFGILILTTAIAGLIKVISDRISWLKRWSWYISVFVEIVGIGIAITYFFQKEPPAPLTEDATQQIVQKAVEEAVSPLVCKIDSLETLIQLQVSATGTENPYRQLAREQAECIEATLVLHRGMDSGIVLVGLGKYREAITHLDYAILAAQDDSSKAEGYFYRGVAFHLRSDSLEVIGKHDSATNYYQQAIADYDIAIAHRRDFPEAWSNRGAALNNVGEYREAVKSYDTVLAYQPGLPMVWCNRAIALNHLGLHLDEIASYDSALRYEHDNAYAWFKRSNAYYYLDQYELAAASYDSSLAYRRDDHETWLNRGNALGSLNRCDEAAASYDSALAYKHDFASAWSNLGIALACLKRYEEALASCDSALKYDPNLTEAAELRKTILEEMKE